MAVHSGCFEMPSCNKWWNERSSFSNATCTVKKMEIKELKTNKQFFLWNYLFYDCYYYFYCYSYDYHFYYYFDNYFIGLLDVHRATDRFDFHIGIYLILINRDYIWWKICYSLLLFDLIIWSYIWSIFVSLVFDNFYILSYSILYLDGLKDGKSEIKFIFHSVSGCPV